MKPIIMQGRGVAAMLETPPRKTQTRRIIEAGCRCPFEKAGDVCWVREKWKCEAYSHHTPTNGPEEAVYYIAYWADRGHSPRGKSVTFPSPASNAFQKNRDGWRPSIHMPAWAHRLRLHFTRVWECRVQDISEADAIAEGVEHLFGDETEGYENYLWHGHFGAYGMGNKQSDAWPHQYSDYQDARGSFSSLWELINAKRGYGWDANPLVRAGEYEVEVVA